jgi:hypothetical protein
MKYLSFVVLFCLLGFFSCEQNDFSPQTPEPNPSGFSEKVDGNYYSTITELAHLLKGLGKSLELVTEDEIASVAAAENIDVVLIGQRMMAKIHGLKAEGLSDEAIAERIAEEQLSAMGITRDKLGTPCYDSYIDNLRTTHIGLAICIGLKPGALFGCTLGALAGQLNALIKYETCLDNRYPSGG